jgi:hypothetical protein
MFFLSLALRQVNRTYFCLQRKEPLPYREGLPYRLRDTNCYRRKSLFILITWKKKKPALQIHFPKLKHRSKSLWLFSVYIQTLLHVNSINYSAELIYEVYVVLENLLIKTEILS